MSKIITIPEMGIIVDSIYRNYSRAKLDQKSVKQLAVDCNTSANTIIKIRTILATMKLLIIEGDRRTQKCYWNPDKCTPNPVMLTEVYRVYTKDVKSRVKVNPERVKRLPSLESALLAFKKAGWNEITLKKTVGNTTDIKIIDLVEVRVGE